MVWPMTHNILAPGVATDATFKHVRSMFESDPCTTELGATITHIDLGECTGHFVIRENQCNGHGTVQGGILFTFADSLFAGACNAAGEVAVATHNSIHYIAPAFAGQRIDGHARTVQKWGRNGFVDVSLTCEGNPIAEFRGTFRILPKRPEQK